MLFYSTRDEKKNGVSGAYAICHGLASDGGLYMPDTIPALSFDELKELQHKNYFERAAYVLSKFLADFSYEELLDSAKQAYSEDKFGPSPTPVYSYKDGFSLLELWHGPTCAFKDMALQMMPHLLVKSLKKLGENRTAFILVATSGDTGKAALEGFKDIPGTKIEVFYPTDGVSTIQKLQMQTQEGNNVEVVGIRGNFDDAQSAVKAAFANEDIIEVLNKNNAFFSSANSINFGRLVPQVVYYVSSYLDLVNENKIQFGDLLDVCVPTGNFGNIFAAYIAKMMGLPLRKLIVASNSNNVLTEFLASGTYNRNRTFYETISPSMDILISSNLERLLYLLFGPTRTATLMRELNTTGAYTLENEELQKIKETFLGGFTNEVQTKETINQAYANYNYLLDPHTAVAVHVGEEYLKSSDGTYLLIDSTASPYKFSYDVLSSIGPVVYCENEEAPYVLEETTNVSIPTPIKNLKEKEPLHTKVVDKSEIFEAIKEFISK